MNDVSGFESRSRADLIEEARRAGVDRPERMTKAELKDEILRLTRPPAEQAEARGFFGVARSMLANVVEGGLNLPDAARLIRGAEVFDSRVRNVAPVATVTLAEIYAAQGHKKRALRMIEEVLEQEPDHEVALRLQSRLAEPEASSDTALATTSGPSYVETTGEEIATGKPPTVAGAEVGSAPAVAPVVAASPISPESRSSESRPSESRSAESSTAEESAVSAESPREAHSPVTAPSTEPRLLVERSARGLHLYWELSRSDIERAGFDVAEAHPALRVVGFEAQRGAPERRERTVRLSVGDASGHLFLEEFSETASVRAAVGLEQEGAFVPLAVGKKREEFRDAAEFLERAGK